MIEDHLLSQTTFGSYQEAEAKEDEQSFYSESLGSACWRFVFKQAVGTEKIPSFALIEWM